MHCLVLREFTRQRASEHLVLCWWASLQLGVLLVASCPSAGGGGCQAERSNAQQGLRSPCLFCFQAAVGELLQLLNLVTLSCSVTVRLKLKDRKSLFSSDCFVWWLCFLLQPLLSSHCYLQRLMTLAWSWVPPAGSGLFLIILPLWKGFWVNEMAERSWYRRCFL